MRLVDAAFPADRTLVVGIGNYSGWPVRMLGVPDPDALVLPWHLGSVGLGLPVGMGAAIARPDRRTLVVEGDGGILMSLPELETAARHGIPNTVLVLDDGVYGVEVHLLAERGRPPSLAELDNPDSRRWARCSA
jgi:acetolactate synthase I/II/III large subunit